MGRKVLAKCVIALIGPFKGMHKNFQKHVEELGGTVKYQIVYYTTHAVFSDVHWKKQSDAVKDALKREKEGHDLKIVSLAWIDDCVNSKSKKKEAPYLWKDIDPHSLRDGIAAAAGVDNGGSAANSAAGSKKGQGPVKSAKGMMMEVFHESTKSFMDPAEMKAIEQRIRYENTIRKQIEVEERQAREKKDLEERRQEVAKIFTRDGARARQELMSNNYHIYADSTTFKYDIVVTKVETYRNRNERYVITMQLYESNFLPQLYAVNLHFAGTRTIPSNNIVGAIGSPFEVAFRTFKEAFRETTGGDWNSRISDYLDGVRSDDKTVFKYEPPLHDPLGDLSWKDTERYEEFCRSTQMARSNAATRAPNSARSLQPERREPAIAANDQTTFAPPSAAASEGTEQKLDSTTHLHPDASAEDVAGDFVDHRDTHHDTHTAARSGAYTAEEAMLEEHPVLPAHPSGLRQASANTATGADDLRGLAQYEDMAAEGTEGDTVKDDRNSSHGMSPDQAPRKLDLGHSILSKRKAEPADTLDEPKRARYSDDFESDIAEAEAQLLAEHEMTGYGFSDIFGGGTDWI